MWITSQLCASEGNYTRAASLTRNLLGRNKAKVVSGRRRISLAETSYTLFLIVLDDRKLAVPEFLDSLGLASKGKFLSASSRLSSPAWRQSVGRRNTMRWNREP